MNIIPEKSAASPLEKSLCGAGQLRELIGNGEYLKAFELGDRYMNSVSNPDIDIVKLHSLCLSRLEMLSQAIDLLEQSAVPECEDHEIPALLGSYYKKSWLRDRNLDPESAEKALSRSFEYYLRSRELGCDYWCTVNAATLALFRGDSKLARELADEVISECWDMYNKHGTSSEYWVLTSLGESYLIKEDYKTAARWYTSSRSHLKGRLGNIRSARSNAEMLLQAISPSAEQEDLVLSAIRRPKIVAFAGHRVDRTGTGRTRFPETISSRVKRRLKKFLLELKPDIGIASAADGSDILFHECMQEMNRRTHLILPEPADHFRKRLHASNKEKWIQRFDKVLSNAETVEISSHSRFESEAVGAYKIAADYLLEYSLEKARSLDAELVPLVVWDERSSIEPGGTGYIVSSFRHLGFEPGRIPIDDLVGNSANQVGETGKPEEYSYESMGIYEPAVRSLIVLRPARDDIPEESMAALTGRLVRIAGEICTTRSIRLLSSSLVAPAICLLLESAGDAWHLCRDLRAGEESIGEYSAVLHSALAVMLDGSLTGKREYYFGELSEVMELSKTLRTSDDVLTMQFRSLLRQCMPDLPERNFQYFSIMNASNGASLKIIKVI
jgi:hypothetical protein